MLAGHPRLWVPPEMVIAPFETMAERAAHMEKRFWEKTGLRRAIMDALGVDVDGAKTAEAALDEKAIPEVYAFLQQRIGDRTIVDKCPHLSVTPVALERVLRWFPEARFVWIVRHPGSVIRSLENMPMAEVMLQGYEGDAERMWLESNRNAEQFLEGIPKDRWAVVRYEDLVADPRPPMERACAALGVAFDAAVLDPYEGDRMREGAKGARAIGDPNMAGRGKIDAELATSWLEGFDPRRASAETKALAARLGYDLDSMPLPPITKVSEGIASLFEIAKELEATIKLPMDVDAVEGRRFLLRMLSASIDTFVEGDDADRPVFRHAEGPTRKMFADCPDTNYLRAPIRVDGGRVYRLSGRIPAGALYVGVVLYGKGGRVARRLADRDLEADADGRFEVKIAVEPQPGPWLRCDGDENAVIVRQYFADRAREPEVEVELALLGDPPPAREMKAGDVARQIERAGRMLRSVFDRTYQAYRMGSQMALNRFVELPAESLFPTPDNRYQICWYRFGFDQIMLVRGKMPKARYFSLTLYNAWLESLDYERRRVILNHSQIVAAPDGSYEICLAQQNPGHPNWLDPCGHAAGYLVSRSLLPEGELPSIEVEVLYRKEYAARR